MDTFVDSSVETIDRFSEKLLIGTAITCDGKLIGCDQALAQALEYMPDEMLYREVSCFASEDQADALMDRIRRHDTSWYDLNLLTKSGNIIPAIVIPEEMNLEGRVVRTSVFLHREPIKETESDLINSLKNAIATLSKTIEARDPYTAGHQARVTSIATMIGREMAMDTTCLRNIELAAYIHDIGKISIPSEILIKPGKLNQGEWILIKSHPVIGEEIIRDVSCAPEVKSMIRSHHERLDGSGYPDGLSGDQVPIDVRILCIADAMDAIAGIRPYHPMRTMTDAIEILEGCGDAYDHDVISAARSLDKRGELVGREYTGSTAT